MNDNIEFNDEQQGTAGQNPRFLYSRFQSSSEKPGVVNFLINHKIVKNENGANIFLIIITIIFFASSILLFMYGNGSFKSKVKPTDPNFPFGIEQNYEQK